MSALLGVSNRYVLSTSAAPNGRLLLTTTKHISSTALTPLPIKSTAVELVRSSNIVKLSGEVFSLLRSRRPNVFYAVLVFVRAEEKRLSDPSPCSSANIAVNVQSGGTRRLIIISVRIYAALGQFHRLTGAKILTVSIRSITWGGAVAARGRSSRLCTVSPALPLCGLTSPIACPYLLITCPLHFQRV